jgi:hypothetical protein
LYRKIRSESDMTDRVEQEPTTGGTDAQGEAQTALLRRRNLLKASLGAGSVIATLASRPVLGWGGGGGDCKAPSDALSGNLSQPGTTKTCSGKPPTYWCQSQSYCNWKIPCQPKDTGSSGYTCGAFKAKATPFHSTITMFNGTQFGSKTMLDVMNLTGGGYQKLGCYISAALLNAKAGWTPVLSESDVRGMWNEYCAKGYFEPSAGVHWGPDECVNYLLTTMTG